ncbi:hypothetical protein [Polymorphospora rubra]|uniref:XRE family transcriptional regulator n=1 Tax=Polymorphospora rubra TaxID=338584 RepID=A0A810N093_9ACTN|nr:hypothetical protein [Polymorphospora rubra]BCJ65639.1 hypothetical protein Prubr_26600 [Polymorphospora rubra]
MVESKRPALPNERLRAARERLPSPSGSGLPMSRQELADAINAYLADKSAADGPIDRTQIARFERGLNTWPRAPRRAAFRAVLGASTDAELGFFNIRRPRSPDTGLSGSDRHQEPSTVSPAPAAGSDTWAIDGLSASAPGARPAGRDAAPTAVGSSTAAYRDGDDPVNRRAVLYGLMGAAGATAGSSLAAHLEALRRGLDDGLSGDVVDSADVDEWERVTDQYAHDVGLLSAGRVLPQLATDLEDVQARLRSVSGKRRADLAHVCARLSALIAITLLNLDEAQMARRYWRTATRAADQTPDRQLRALIRGRRAVFSLYDQRSASTVLALADEAIDVAPGIACTGTVSAHAARAQALALLGQHGAARDALDETSRVFARLPDATVADRSSQWGWSEQRLRHVESHVHSYAGRAHDAAKAQNMALSLYPPQAYQGPAQIELHRAVSMIVAGDPSEGARHTARTVSGLPPHVRDDALIRRTAALALDTIPAGAAKLPAVSQARDLLALPIGHS